MNNKAYISSILFLLLGFGVYLSPSPQKVATLVSDAHDCFDTLDYETGLRLANRALEKDPSRWTLRLRQAVVLHMLDRKEVAWIALNRAIRDARADGGNDRNYEPEALAALWAYQEGRYEEAEDLARRASRRAASSLHLEKGAKPNWPPAFAPGLYAIPSRAEKSKARSLFYPNAGLASYILGVILESRTGWTAECESRYLEALRLSYDAKDCAGRIALGRLRSNDAAGAFRISLAACDQGGLHPDLCLLIAASLEAMGDQTATVDRLSLAVDLGPFRTDLLRAQAAAEAAEGRIAAASAILRRILILDPADKRARDYLISMDRGRPLPGNAISAEIAFAIAALSKRLEPRWSYELWRTPAAVADSVNGRFIRYVRAGLVDDAARYVELFLATYVSAPTLGYNLAQVYHLKGRLEAAFRHAWMAAAVQPDYRDALDAAGSLLFDIGDYTRSVLLYESAKALSPADPVAWYNLACARLGGGDPAGAEADLLRAIEVEGIGPKPADQDDGAGEGFPLENAVTFGRMRNISRSAPISDQPEAANEEGLGYEVGVQVDSVAYQALVQLATIRLQRGDSEGALNILNEAIRRQPDSSDAYLEIGRTELATGNNAVAEAAFAKYLARGGSASKVEAVRKQNGKVSVPRP